MRMGRIIWSGVFFLLWVACTTTSPDQRGPQPEETGYGVFHFQLTADLPGTPDAVYDLITGDISPWWDHSFSDHPDRFFIEAQPGGGFWEYFDEAGNGVLHARVTAADRGKLLRFDGPLGLAGKAVHMVTTYTFAENENGGTTLAVDVHAAGEMEPGTDAVVKSVWQHFIFDRFQPYCSQQLGDAKPNL